MPNDPLTTTEVASRLGISVSSVIRLVEDGKLPHRRKLPGRRGTYLFDLAVVLAYELSTKMGAPTADGGAPAAGAPAAAQPA